MRIDFVTLFPEIIESYFSAGILHQGIKKELIEIKTHYLRDFAAGNYRQVDDRVYGGGAGMVLMFEPIKRCIAAIKTEYKKAGLEDYKVVATTAKGETYRQPHAKEFASYEGLIILCGRYEGFDQRILDELVDIQISIGNYVLTGGELAALTIADSTLRLLPGVLGKEESFQHDSFYEDDNIQFPQYTRPEVIETGGKKLEVPKILLSGDHAAIEKWRKTNRRVKT